jgi:putative ABC transport system permease protein
MLGPIPALVIFLHCKDELMAIVFNAFRGLLAAPRFAALVLLSLFLGLLGLSLAGSVIEQVLLRALPFTQPERLVAVNEMVDGRVISMTQQNARDLETADSGLSGIALYAGGPSTVRIDGRNWIAQAQMVGADFFRVLQAPLLMGRGFDTAADLDKNPKVALISEALWRSRFGASTKVLGQSLQAYGHEVQVIGVVPQAQVFPAGTDVWLPDRIDPINPSRTSHGLRAIGRLRADHSMALAQSKLDTLGALWKAKYGAEMTTTRFPMRDLRDALVGNHAQVLWTTVAAAAFLLLIAGLNASNLYLVHSLSLAQQNATKLGLGAKAEALARELVCQALMLSGLAWLLAWLATSRLLAYAQAMLQVALPRAESIGMSTHVLLLMAVLSVILALACVLMPIRALYQRNVLAAMRESTRSHSESRTTSRLRSGLTALQTVLTVVMLSGTLLLWQSVERLLQVDTGFRIDGVAVASVSQNMSGLPDAHSKLQNYLRVLTSLQQKPGVTHVALSSGLPLSNKGSDGGFLKEMPNAPQPAQAEMEQVFTRYATEPKAMQGAAQFRVVSQDFFATLDIALRAGRFFMASDTVDRQHVAVISEALAKASYPDGNAIGQKIQFAGMDGDVRQLLIVGIASDVRSTALDAPPDAIVYVHLLQRPLQASDATLIMRGDISVASMQAMLSAELSRQANLPADVTNLAALRDRALGSREPLLLSFAGFVGLAMLLAALGVYGLVRYNLAQKTPEIWLRRALGATRIKLVLQQLAQSMRIHLVAIALGLGLALILARAIASQLFGVSAYDPATFVGAGLLMAAVCALAVVMAALATRVLRQVDPKLSA